jgi:hypothetical protein
VSEKSDNPNDNIFVVDNTRIFVINIMTFLTNVRFEQDNFYNYDLREPKRKIIHPDKLRETRQTVVHTDDWTNIPYYPTTRERRENMANEYVKQGRPIPPQLLHQIQQDKAKEVQHDVYNKSIVLSQQPQQPHQQPQQPPQLQQQQLQQQQLKQQYQQQRQQQQRQTPPNKFSQEYASYVGQKPRATASAKIRLGGTF